MPGVYARGEFTDNYGTDWKIDIYDTTYGSGIVYPFTPASNGFTRDYEGITDKPLFTPAYKSRITAKIMITENDGPIEALISDIANGLEDQFYMLVYKDAGAGYVLWFAGMILCDLCQYDDMQRFVFEVTATDGFNRLENFDYPISDVDAIAVDGFISELDAIRLALQICGIERFFGSSDYYIGVAVNWHEINQAKIKTSLVETRVSIDSFIDDWEEQRPKRALDVINGIIGSYGAQIRFEGGMWRITQIETQNSATIDYEYYNKAGALETTATEATEQTIGSSDNNTNDLILNQYLPSLYGVVTTVTEESKLLWGRNEDIIAPATLNEVVSVDGVDDYVLTVDIGYLALSSAATPTTRVYFRIERDGYLYVRNHTGITTPFWIATGSFNPAIQSGIFREFVNDSLTFVRRTFSFVIPPSPTAAAGQTIDFTTVVFNTTSGANQDFTSYSHTISDYWDGRTDRDLSFIATNTIVGAASVFLEEKMVYCDSSRDFVFARKKIYDGANWIPSEEWASGTVAVTGKPFDELICAKAVYFQRFPRLLIQGSLILPQYDSLVSVYWRSRRFIMFNGSFDAKSGRWSGVWAEMIEQDADVVSAPRNPYRDQSERDEGDIRTLTLKTSQNTGDILENKGDIFLLRQVNTSAKTGNYTILISETGTTYTNDGTSANIIFTLPPIVKGAKFRFTNVDNTYKIEINTDGADSSVIHFANASGSSLDATALTSIQIAATTDTVWSVINVDDPSQWTLT